MTSSPIPAARSQYLLDLLAQVPDPRKKRGRRHALAGLLAVGIAAVIAGSKSFAAIGQWAADAGPEVLAVLGAVRGAAEESTFRRAFALVSPDVLDRVLGAWLWTRAVRAAGRLVIAIDGKTVRGAKNKDGKAPHLVAALAHGIGAVLGQVAVEEKSNEIPAVRELLKAFADLAGAVLTIDAMRTQHDTAKLIVGRGVGYVMTVKRATDYDVSVPGCRARWWVTAVAHPLHGCQLRAYAVRHVGGVAHLKVELPDGMPGLVAVGATGALGGEPGGAGAGLVLDGDGLRRLRAVVMRLRDGDVPGPCG
jgi:predicted transposase YbfD/YdcC